MENNINENLTSAEMGKLWATYMGNSMAKCILSYYLQHVKDEDIKTLLENALKLSDEFLKTTKEIYLSGGQPGLLFEISFLCFNKEHICSSIGINRSS